MRERYSLVVIGGSRGGLEALFEVCRELPSNFPLPLVVTLHIHAESPKLGADILGRRIALPVSYAQDNEQPLPAHIYLAPPGNHLIVNQAGRLTFDPGPKVHHSRPAADRLFETAAQVFAAGVIGVVLTGGDHDGAAGLAGIKQAGGVGIVQLPREAIDPSMPRSALQRDHPDYTLPASEIGKLLVELACSS